MQGSVKALWTIFDSRSRALVIPVYQRNYDWTETQCERLFDDLEEILTQGRKKHFFGALVGKAETSFKWVVIDGQQRLTTISLLILALIHAARNGTIELDDSGLPDKLEKSYLLYDDTQSDMPKVKLKPVKDDAEAYQRLFGPTEDHLPKSTVTANYTYFRERLEKTAFRADEIWDAISRLEVMMLDLEDRDDPQRIFETLNSTGLALREADKIRNHVLMGLSVDKQEELYEKEWNPMEKSVGFRTDWFIRWYLVTVTSRTPREDHIYESFKRYAKSSKLDIDALLHDMREFARYAEQIKKATTGNDEIDRALAHYLPIHSSVILPFLMPVLRDYHAGIVSAEDMARIIRILESYLLRRTICGMWTNALNKIFATAYADIQRLRTGNEPYSEILIYLLRRRDRSSGSFPTDEQFIDALQTRNIYRLRSQNRSFFFECLENLRSNDTRDIAQRLENGELSVEHIMPQNLTSAWKKDLGPNHEQIHRDHCHRLGNLTVTGYNSTYSNAPFSQKRDMDGGFRDSPYRLNSDVKNQEVWGEQQIIGRTDRLTKSALDLWPYVTTDFAPPSPTLPREPMGHHSNFTGRTLVAYEYGDVSATVSTWSAAMPGIIRALMRDHRAAVYAAAQTTPLLSTDPQTVNSDNREWRTVDEGLAVYVATSTMTKVQLLRALFEALDLDPNELVFTLRGEDRGTDSLNADGTADELNDGPYAELIKFTPRFAELGGSSADLAATAALRQEFAQTAAPLVTTNVQILDHPARSYTPELIRQARPEQVLALIGLTLQSEQHFDERALHEALLSGQADAWLEVLGRAPATP